MKTEFNSLSPGLKIAKKKSTKLLAFSLLMNEIVTAEIVMMMACQRARPPVHIPWSNNTSTASSFYSGTRSKWSQVQFLIKTTVNLVCDTHTLSRTHSRRRSPIHTFHLFPSLNNHFYHSTSPSFAPRAAINTTQRQTHTHTDTRSAAR